MAKVSVGCKLPNGLHLDIPGADRVTLMGSNASMVIGGYGITEDVDKDFFEKWLSIYKDAEYVKGGFIFAHAKAAEVKAQAADNADNTNGFEGLDPVKPAPGIEQATA